MQSSSLIVPGADAKATLLEMVVHEIVKEILTGEKKNKGS